MKKILLFGGILAVSVSSLFSQANPGYLGRKNSVELTGSYNFGSLFGIAVASANAYNSSFGFGLEHTFSKKFSLAGGVRFGSINIDANTMNSNLFYDFSNLQVQQTDQNGIDQVYNLANGSVVATSLSEIYVTPRFYIKNKGNIAPLGAFVGTELSMGKVSIASQSTKMVLKDGSETLLPVRSFNTSFYSFTLQCGIKRMVTDEIGVQMQYGMGLILSQGLSESAYFNDFPISHYSSINALVRDGVLNDLAYNKLMQLHASVVYLF